ncbi:MAG TPA: hypothetical protein VMR76_01900 [Candidatus Saccharimonadia bacterium]|nr:hypothetical protein [Candidatus Saccharimonadia bacterium]
MLKVVKKLKRLSSQGFSHVELVLLMIVIIVIAGIGAYVLKHNSSHASGYNYSSIGSANLGAVPFYFYACSIQSGSVYTIRGEAAVNRRAGYTTETPATSATPADKRTAHNGIAGTGFNPLIAVQAGSLIEYEDNWNPSSTSYVFTTSSGLNSGESFRLGVFAAGRTTPVWGPTYSAGNIGACSTPVPTNTKVVYHYVVVPFAKTHVTNYEIAHYTSPALQGGVNGREKIGVLNGKIVYRHIVTNPITQITQNLTQAQIIAQWAPYRYWTELSSPYIANICSGGQDNCAPLLNHPSNWVIRACKTDGSQHWYVKAAVVNINGNNNESGNLNTYWATKGGDPQKADYGGQSWINQVTTNFNMQIPKSYHANKLYIWAQVEAPGGEDGDTAPVLLSNIGNC